MSTLPVARLVAVLALCAAFPLHAEYACKLPQSEYSAIEDLCPFSEGLAAFSIGGTWGYLDRQGRLAIPPTFDETQGFSEGLAPAAADDKWGYIDSTGRWAIAPTHREARHFSEGLAVVENEDGQDGVIDRNGRWIVPPGYMLIEPYANGLALARTKAWRQELLDRQGRIVHRFADDLDIGTQVWPGHFKATQKFAPELHHGDGRRQALASDSAPREHCGRQACFSEEKENDETRYRLIDGQGREIVATRFSEAADFTRGQATVRVGKSYGVIDETGKFIVPAEFERIDDLPNGMYLAMPEVEGTTRHIFDRQGKERLVLQCQWPDSRQYGDWLVLSACGRQAWVFHAAGQQFALDLSPPPAKPTADDEEDAAPIQIAAQADRLLVQRRYTKPDSYVDGVRFALLTPDKVLLTDSSPAFAGQFDGIDLITDQQHPRRRLTDLPLARLHKGYKTVGIVTADGNIVSDLAWQYDRNSDSNYNGRLPLHGPLVMKAGDKFGAITATGAWAIPPRYDSLGDFIDGLALARSDGQRLAIDSHGRSWPLPEEGRYQRLGNGLLADENADDENRFLRLGNDGVTPVPGPEGIEDLGNAAIAGLVPARLKSGWGVLDNELRWVLPPTSRREPEALWQEGKFLGWRFEAAPAEAHGESAGSGLLAPDGKVVIAPRYHSLRVLEDSDVALIEVEEHAGGETYRGLYRPDGSQFIAPAQANIRALGDGWFLAQPQTLTGIMDSAGRWILAPGRYRLSELSPAGYARETVAGEPANVRGDGSISTPSQPLAWPEETAAAWQKTETEIEGESDPLLTYRGFDWQQRLQLRGEVLHDFAEGWTVLTRHYREQRYLASSDGRLVGPLPYDEVEPVSGGLAMVVKTLPAGPRQPETVQRIGFIDTQGKLVIPPRYEAASNFSEGRAAVVYQGNLGLIDERGKLLVHGGWRCGTQAVLLDGQGKAIWPAGKASCR